MVFHFQIFLPKYQVYTNTKHWIKLHIISVINIEYCVKAFIKILQVIVEQNIFLNKRHHDKNLVVHLGLHERVNEESWMLLDCWQDYAQNGHVFGHIPLLAS